MINEKYNSAFNGDSIGEALRDLRAIEPEFRTALCDFHGEYQEKGAYFLSKNIKWLGCSKCKEERKILDEREAEIIKQIEEQQRIEIRLKKAGIPLRFLDRSLENFIAETSQQKTALTVSRDFLENFDENYKTGRTLIFSGKSGTGKSHLAIAIAKAVMPKYTAMYLNALDAVRMIRDTWRKDSETSELQVLDLLGSIDLLVIDEVGVQYGTDNEQMLMFDIINRRYRDSKPMILLTNLGTTGFSEFLTERSYDRLRENGKWVSFEWRSYRAKVNE